MVRFSLWAVFALVAGLVLTAFAVGPVAAGPGVDQMAVTVMRIDDTGALGRTRPSSGGSTPQPADTSRYFDPYLESESVDSGDPRPQADTRQSGASYQIGGTDSAGTSTPVQQADSTESDCAS